MENGARFGKRWPVSSESLRYTVCPSVSGDGRCTVPMLKGRLIADTGAGEWFELVGGRRKRMKNGIVRVITLTSRRTDNSKRPIRTLAGVPEFPGWSSFFHAIFSTNLKIHVNSLRLKDALSRLRAGQVARTFQRINNLLTRYTFVGSLRFFQSTVFYFHFDIGLLSVWRNVV